MWTGAGTTNSGNEIEQLSASVDFLVELCETISLVNVCSAVPPPMKSHLTSFLT